MSKTSQSAVNKMFFYERFADQFDSVVNMYDTTQRLKVVFEELLPVRLKGKKVLDAGCGTGWFSQRAAAKGAQVTSMDLGRGLLNQVAKKCKSRRVVGSILEMPFADTSFDYVISSEVIEHVVDRNLALREIYRVLKPGGTAVITTPNRVWYFSLLIANYFKLRPYQGLENWSGWSELKISLEAIGFEVVEMRGVHLFPFVIPVLNPVLDFFHPWNRVLGPLMVNIAVKCRRK